jgi:3-methylfumaryl-CoA hydratase
MATTELNLDELRSHIGRRLAVTDVVTETPPNLLRLTFGRPDPEFRAGDALPPGWHILYFLPRVPPDGLGKDGAPHDTGVVPAVPLPRRMFAGERLRFHRPLRIGDAVRRETELADISLKQGSTGTLVFATVVSRISGPDGLAIEEERRSVFREDVKGGRNEAPRREEPPADPPWRRRIVPDAVALFRFSALTFNSHRIHYDHPWATAVEGYPDLVVHGPFTSTLLIDFVRDRNPGRAMASYTTQARAPLFVDAPFELCGRPTADGRGAEAWAVTPGGTVAMAARVEFAR